VLSDNVRTWSLEGPLDRLRPFLPLHPPEGPSPLLSGQYWKLALNLRPYGLYYNDVVRIDGRYNDKVVVTRFRKAKDRNQVTHCPAQLHVPLSFLFSSSTSTRCNLIHMGDSAPSLTGQMITISLTVPALSPTGRR